MDSPLFGLSENDTPPSDGMGLTIQTTQEVGSKILAFLRSYGFTENIHVEPCTMRRKGGSVVDYYPIPISVLNMNNEDKDSTSEPEGFG